MTLFKRKIRKDIMLVQIYVDDIIFGSTNEKFCRDFEDVMKPKFEISKMGELTFFLGLEVKRSNDGTLILQANHPVIMFVVCYCNRYQTNPKKSHEIVVKRIFRYMKGTPRLGLWYPKANSFGLIAYSNSDHGGCQLDRKSVSGGFAALKPVDSALNNGLWYQLEADSDVH
ncbi:hypothetical protein L1987_03469 [Smallanthus sonchifolius]|uniref:Uncharacterized protein n=1 Tax=Smallanthus sonchifolius TaxID=185202 RepID=A0ACB9KAQ2_9ASTR|nr:hypothetical protein L1987_03469 [Smallanthus sonchifolius]